MRILIAGCGYVGIRLAKLLHHAGNEVYGLRRNPPGEETHLTWIRGDLTDTDSIHLPSQLNILVLAAGLRRDAEERYQQLFVDGYRNLFDRIKNEGHPIQRIVMASTTGVFAEQDGHWVDENSQVNRDHSPGRYYLAAEDLVRDSGWPSVIVRLSGIYGPDRQRLIREVRDGRAQLLPLPAHHLNQLHADDAAGALAHVIQLKHPNPLYIACDREPADRNDVLSWMARQIGSDIPPMMDEQSSRPVRRSGNKRCRSDLLAASGYQFKYPTFREGYRALIDDQ